jgi:hypothetical protein
MGPRPRPRMAATTDRREDGMPVGPGSVLAARYTVVGRVQQHPRWERWTARDATLERDVVLLCFPLDAPTAAAALDAARRAAGIEDSRLVRVLDVGAGPDTSFVVEEPLTGSHSVRALVEAGGLPAEEARRIAGESATALAAAATRGLHHGQLTPRDILVLPDGAVKVRGLATQAALVGEEDLPVELASHADVAALAGVLYAGLTGRWPLPGPDAGLEAAPRLGAGVAAPGELAAGVTADLDRLTTVTLNEGKGPATPALFAAALRPWSAVPVTEPGDSVVPTRHTAGEPTVPYPMPPRPTTKPASTGAAARSGAGPVGSATPTGTTGTTGTTGPPGPSEEAAGGADDAAAPSAPAALVRGVGEALSGAGSAAAAAAGRVGAFARGAADRLTERSAERAERRAYEHTPLEPEPLDTHLSDVLEETEEGLGAPAPLLPEDLGEEPTRDESKIALAFVAGLLVLIAILGVWGLPKLGFGGGGGNSPATPRPSATGSPTAGSSTGSTGSTGGTGASAGTQGTGGTGGADGFTPVGVVGSAGFEPSGAGQVASTTAARAFDGKPATLWRSKWYSSAKFGGLQVSGIGVVADLGNPVAVRRVTLTLPAAQDVTVYVASRASLAGAQVLGTSTGASGQVVLDAAQGPLTGQLVIIVVTTLAPDGEGHFRAQISEVQVAA